MISDRFQYLSNGTEEHQKSEDKGSTSPPPSCRREIFAASVALLWSVMGGAAAGWSAPALPILMHKARGAFWWERNSSFALGADEVSANGSAPLRCLTLEEASWVVAMLPLGALLSTPFALWMSKRRKIKAPVGPRAALLALSPAAVSGWLLMAFAPNYECVLVGRVLVGVTWGASGVLAPAFVSSLPSVASAAALRRGMLTSRRPATALSLTLTASRASTAAQKLLIVAAAGGRGPLKASAVYPATALGTLLVAAFGAALSSYVYFTAAMALLPALFCLAFWFVPESPWDLCSVGEVDAAAAALRWYRGGSSSVDVRPELDWISTALEVEKSLSEDALTKQRPISQIALCDKADQSVFPAMFPRVQQHYLSSALVSRYVLVRPVMVSAVLSALHQLCGVNAFVLYTCQIFDGVGSWVSGLISAVVLSAVHFLGATISSRFIDRLTPRGFLLSLSSGGMALSLAAFGVYSYFHIALDSDDLGIGEIGFIPIVSISTFMVFYSFGLGPLLPLAIAEALPTTHRNHLLPVVLMTGRVISVALAKEVPIFIDVMKHYVVFGMFFGGFCAVCCVFVTVISLCGKLRSKR